MTSAQLITHERDEPARRGRRYGARMARLSVLLLAVLSGCAIGPKLEEPKTLASPYATEEVWAVAPFMNESGTTVVDSFRAADLLVQELEQVDGLHAVPVNRVIRAMRELELSGIATPAEARMVARVLDVDAILIGTITAYDPYPPPTIGAAIALYRVPRDPSLAFVDTRELSASPVGEVQPGALDTPGPDAQAAGMFDASNHRTLRELHDYALGRALPDSAYGRDIYLVSSELYTRFVSYRLLQDLLARERQRLAAAGEMHPTPPR